jgi:hypothetical protein
MGLRLSGNGRRATWEWARGEVGMGLRLSGNGRRAKWEWARCEVGMGPRLRGNGPEATWEWARGYVGMGPRLSGNGRRTETVNTSTAMCRNGTSSLQHNRCTPDATTPLLHINPLALQQRGMRTLRGSQAACRASRTTRPARARPRAAPAMNALTPQASRAGFLWISTQGDVGGQRDGDPARASGTSSAARRGVQGAPAPPGCARTWIASSACTRRRPWRTPAARGIHGARRRRRAATAPRGSRAPVRPRGEHRSGCGPVPALPLVLREY